MKIKILGSGSAFDVEKTNSSFLVDDKLVDCGYNVFTKLRKENINVNEVFITHIHFDHIGSLETLIYYNFFIRKIKTKIYADKIIIDELKRIFLTSLNDEMVEYIVCNNTVKGNHGRYNNYGFVFENVIITGDTLANQEIKNKILELLKKYNQVYIFHDFCDFPNDVHCYEDNFNEYYEDLLDKNVKFIFYHNGENEGYKLNI